MLDCQGMHRGNAYDEEPSNGWIKLDATFVAAGEAVEQTAAVPCARDGRAAACSIFRAAQLRAALLAAPEVIVHVLLPSTSSSVSMSMMSMMAAAGVGG